MNVIVALYKVNTQHLQSRSLATRLNLLEQAVDRVFAFMNQQVPHNVLAPQPLRGIFLAPEYMFSRSISGVSYNAGVFQRIRFGTQQGDDRQGEHRFGERRQIEASENLRVRSLIEKLSQQSPGLLLIPGTVAWRKPLPVDPLGRLQKTTKYARVLFGAADMNMETVQGRVPVNWPVFPSQYSHTPHRPVHTPLDKTYELGTALYVAKNTAYCYFNGRCLFKYNKIGDFHEVHHDVIGGPDTVHIPAAGPGRFRVPGTNLDLGIAVCYDQSLNATQAGTQNRIPLQHTATPVDIHILLSAHISPQFGAANLKQGGWLLSCSSDDTCNQALTAVIPQGAAKHPSINVQDPIDLYTIVV